MNRTSTIRIQRCSDYMSLTALCRLGVGISNVPNSYWLFLCQRIRKDWLRKMTDPVIRFNIGHDSGDYANDGLDVHCPAPIVV